MPYREGMRIGALAAAAGVTTKTIRFYEQAGLLPDPPRTSAGYRDYPPPAADRLAFIREAGASGLTLAEIRGVLAIRDAGEPPCRHVAVLIDNHLSQIDQRITELLAARGVLEDLRTRASGLDPADCAPDDVCAIIPSR